MRTKIILLAILNILLWNGVATAQTIYYQKTEVIHGDGFTYQCDRGKIYVKLYNINNKFTNTSMVYKDGTMPPLEVGMSIPVIEPNNNGYITRDIINSILTEREKEMLKKYNGMLQVTTVFDSGTGKIIEVNFEFQIRECTEVIPPERFFKIEQELKKVLSVTPTETGKKLKCISPSWFHMID